ncbi:MAG TPA: CehA/McbA family metallohydrolase [Pirellulales bacterium]|jgi:hypothetical protein|nr:CehA/McbA family metallohydrolase [Pirellulales bacterium]
MLQFPPRHVALLWALCGFALLDARAMLAGPGGVLKVSVVDRDTGQPLACRMHLVNAAKRPLKAPKVPFWHDHFVFEGTIALKLPKGEYTFEIERGPEYLTRSGHFTMEEFSDDAKVVDLKRFADMALEGWWSGDLDAARPAKDLELLMEAEDLHVVELVTWPGGKDLLAKTVHKGPLVQFDQNHFYHLSAGRDVRSGGCLLFFNLQQPLKTQAAGGEFDPRLDLIAAAHAEPKAWVDAPQAFAWDLPLWVASQGLNSIELAGSNLGRKSAVNHEGGGKPRDKLLFPNPTGNGRWNESIYYHLLNCGLHIVPTAGSGSGNVANPLGYNRMYVQAEGPLTYEKWWEGVRAGRVVVTNGPLIRPNVEGQMPGYVFRAAKGEQIELEVGLTLSTRDRVSYLEIIKDGRLEQQVRLDDWAKMGGKLPPLKFDASGWFLIRAVTDYPGTYRFASTAPYWVEFDERPRIGKESAEFFLDWLTARTTEVKRQFGDGEQAEAVLAHYRRAHAFWQDLVARANAP